MNLKDEEFSFSLFEVSKTRNIKNDEPLVEIRTNGRIVFNIKASDLLNDSHFCMLGYDEINNTLGILPISEIRNNSFPIRYATKGAYIGAKKFFKHFNILPKEQIQDRPFWAGQFIGVKL
ncbi:hypothetical protein LJC10_04310 [Selenomonadales bacterium OttesenSCG-928-I06]|nr:hypothetical protein [Selenomonadales bacterium OttesenSCG-928-I06]